MPALGSVEAQRYKQARVDAQRRMGRLRPDPRPDRDLAAYLRSEFQTGEPMALTTRDATATGRALSDRMVSRLEVETALRWLPWRQRRVVELRFVADLPVREVCQRLNISPATLYEEQNRALEAMVDLIYEWAA